MQVRIRALHACFVYVCTIYGWMDERLHRLSSSSAAGARAHFWMWKQKSRALTAPCRLSPRTSNDIASQGESGQASQKASKPPTRIWQPSTRPSWRTDSVPAKGNVTLKAQVACVCHARPYLALFRPSPLTSKAHILLFSSIAATHTHAPTTTRTHNQCGFRGSSSKRTPRISLRGDSSFRIAPRMTPGKQLRRRRLSSRSSSWLQQASSVSERSS